MAMTQFTISSGTLIGFTEDGVSRFTGIPYAAPPLGERRFLPPAPVAAWDKPLQATSISNRAMQPPLHPFFQSLGQLEIGETSEDCLYLNVYAPAQTDSPRPVMVWIHGGGYISGAANEYDGSILAKLHDVVVVTVNYRLGIFGFINLAGLGPQFEGSANLGIQDQIAALEWVQENISTFGGDPCNVTVFGESAGAGSVLALIASPKADLLFHKAVALSAAESRNPPLDQTETFCRNLEVDRSELVEKLYSLSAENLLELQFSAGVLSPSPAIDGVVLTRTSTEAYAQRRQSAPPLVIGTCRNEGSYLAFISDAGLGLAESVCIGMAYSINEKDPQSYLQYLNTTLENGSEPLKKLERVWQDVFRSSALRNASAASRAGVGAWVYNFEIPTDHELGITHASDLPFVFNIFKDPEAAIALHDKTSPVNQHLADVWSGSIAQFAKTGNPNGAGLPHWPIYSDENRLCMILDEDPVVEQDPDGDIVNYYSS